MYHAGDTLEYVTEVDALEWDGPYDDDNDDSTGSGDGADMTQTLDTLQYDAPVCTPTMLEVSSPDVITELELTDSSMDSESDGNDDDDEKIETPEKQAPGKSELGTPEKPEPGIPVKSEPISVKSEPGIGVKSEPGMAVKSEPGISVKSQLGITVKSELGITVKTEPDIRMKSEPGICTKSEPGIRVKSEPGITVKPEPGSHVKSEPGITVKSEPGIRLKSEPGIHVKSEPGIHVKSEPGIHVKSEPGIPVKSEQSIPVKSEPGIHVKSEISDGEEAEQSMGLGDVTDTDTEAAASDNIDNEHGEPSASHLSYEDQRKMWLDTRMEAQLMAEKQWTRAILEGRELDKKVRLESARAEGTPAEWMWLLENNEAEAVAKKEQWFQDLLKTYSEDNAELEKVRDQELKRRRMEMDLEREKRIYLKQLAKKKKVEHEQMKKDKEREVRLKEINDNFDLLTYEDLELLGIE